MLFQNTWKTVLFGKNKTKLFYKHQYINSKAFRDTITTFGYLHLKFKIQNGLFGNH